MSALRCGSLKACRQFVATDSIGRRNVKKRGPKRKGRFIGAYKVWAGGKWTGKWFSLIQVDGQRRYLGRFPRAMDAAKAYDSAAKREHGKKAVLNFPVNGRYAKDLS